MAELECVLTISAIIMAVGIGILIAIAIVQIVDYQYEHKLNKGYVIAGIIGLVILVISLPIFVRSYKMYYSPELSYERLVKNLDKAEKELQKFYIDYPEFRGEIENE